MTKKELQERIELLESRVTVLESHVRALDDETHAPVRPLAWGKTLVIHKGETK